MGLLRSLQLKADKVLEELKATEFTASFQGLNQTLLLQGIFSLLLVTAVSSHLLGTSYLKTPQKSASSNHRRMQNPTPLLPFSLACALQKEIKIAPEIQS